jgi:hypothetical protein
MDTTLVVAEEIRGGKQESSRKVYVHSAGGAGLGTDGSFSLAQWRKMTAVEQALWVSRRVQTRDAAGLVAKINEMDCRTAGK